MDTLKHDMYAGPCSCGAWHHPEINSHVLLEDVNPDRLVLAASYAELKEAAEEYRKRVRIGEIDKLDGNISDIVKSVNDEHIARELLFAALDKLEAKND